MIPPPQTTHYLEQTDLELTEVHLLSHLLGSEIEGVPAMLDFLYFMPLIIHSAMVFACYPHLILLFLSFLIFIKFIYNILKGDACM